MPEQAKPVVVAADFPGVLENIDARDLPAGAAEEQVNACSVLVGELTVRRGLREVTFDS